VAAPPDTVYLEPLVTAPPDTLALGAPFETVVRFVHPRLEGIELLNDGPALGDAFEIDGVTRGLDRADTAEVRVTLRAWKVGPRMVPPLFWSAYGDEGVLCLAMTDSIPVTVASIVPVDATEPRDIHDPVDVPAPIPWGPIALGAGALLVALMAWAWWRQRGGSDAAGGATARPAHELALEAIDRLAAADLSRRGPWKVFYTELADILRHYLARRYGVDAPDLTTSETLRALREVGLDDEARSALRRVLEEADAIKFARAEPTAEAPSRALADARAVVRRTVPAPEPTSEVAAAEGATVRGGA
jgi:hypothetical protein